MFPAACSRLAYVRVARTVVFPAALQTPALGGHGRGVVSAGRSDHVTRPRGDRSASVGPRAENDSSDSSGPLEHESLVSSVNKSQPLLSELQTHF